jgi:hypothetical protein
MRAAKLCRRAAAGYACFIFAAGTALAEPAWMHRPSLLTAQPSGSAAGRTVAPPAITAAKILTPSVSVRTAPGYGLFSFTFTAPGYYNYNNFIFTGPSGQTVDVGYSIAPPGAEKAGSIVFFNPFSIYTQPGTWTLTEAQIGDLLGNVTVYSGTKLAALFPSLTLKIVNTGPYGSTAPTVTSGKIETPKVSLSGKLPFFRATLAATDDLSGIESTYIYLNEPDGTAYPGFPLILQTTQGLKVNATAGVLLNTPGLPTGTWSVTGYSVCNVAGNCLTETDAATLKQQFGTTTFDVVK